MWHRCGWDRNNVTSLRRHHATNRDVAVTFTLRQEQLHSVLDTLSAQEAGIMSMRFGLTDGQLKTLDEIGKVYGVTRERIRQIESETMSKLQRPGHGSNDEEHGTGRPPKP